jgi:predicted dehydrogenase
MRGKNQTQKHEGVSRRDFGKVAAAAGAAVLSSRTGLAQSKTDTLKIGLLGCGSRGGGACQQMLLANDNVELIAMADLFQDRLDSKRAEIRENANPAISGKYKVDDDHCFVGLDAYKKILDTDIDVVIEGSLPYSRPKHLAAAVDAGKHIFTEKPAAVDPVGIRMVIEAAKKHKEKGLSFVAGTQRRHHSGYQQGVREIQDGKYGDVIALRAYWCGGLPFLIKRQEHMSDFEHQVRNWYAHCWVSGDNIVEQHVHNLDVCNWIKGGHPVEVFASGGRAWKPVSDPMYGDLWDHYSCDYMYEDGTRMTSMSRHWDGLDGGVFEEAACAKGRWDSRNNDQRPPAQRNEYEQEHIDLVNSIRGEGDYWHQGVEVAESTMTAIMGRMSAYSGRKVTWDEAMNSDLSIVPEEWSFDNSLDIKRVPVPPVKPRPPRDKK